jgi:acyl-CoA thioester hydrolase
MTIVPHKDFSFPIRVYWEDTDAGSIVYYANYLKFFERARSEWLRQLGVEQGQLLLGEGYMFVVSEIQTKFHSPARIDNLLAVTVRVKKLGHASIYLHQTAFIQTGSANAPTSLLACEGIVRLACVQQNTMRPTAIPKSIVSLIS